MDIHVKILIVTLSLVLVSTFGSDAIKRSVSTQNEAEKSGEKIRFTTPSREGYYVSCSSPRFKCCDKVPTVTTLSGECLREDNTTGICCNPNENGPLPYGVLEGSLENGTRLLFATNKSPEVLRRQVDNVARVVEENRRLREEMENKNRSVETTPEASS